MYKSNREQVDIGSLTGFAILVFVSLTFAFLAVWHSARADSLTAKDVMTRNEDARKVDDVISTASITTGGGGSPEKVKTFTWWRKLMADRIHFNTLTRFHTPAEVRGEGILFVEHDHDENDVQMYLPAFKKVRRVESQNQSGSFMGSEFSYADIATPHVDDHHYAFQKESECPIDGGKTLRCYVVEATPVSEAVKERTGYAKTIEWVRPDNFMAVKGEFFDKDGVLWKKMEAHQIKEVDTTKHKYMAHQIRIENAKNGKFTLLEFSEVKVNTGIADSIFTVQNLSREK